MAKNGTCFYFFILVCCLLMSCSKNNKNKIKSERSVLRSPFNEQEEEIVKSGMSKQHATSLILMHKVNSDFVDIPIPLGISELVSFPANNGVGKNGNNVDTSLSFKSKNSIAYMVDFYLAQMERFGWQYMGQFNAGGEVLLHFVKPDKKSAISIRPYRFGVFVVVFSSRN